MQARLRHHGKPVSQTFRELAAGFGTPTISIRQLVELVGEQGLLAVCILVSVPFLLPISIPGTSTPFGLIVVLVGIGIAAGQIPWLPGALLRREIGCERMARVLEKGARLFERIERWVHPRWTWLTDGRLVTRLNGVGLIVSGLLLLAPLPIPGTNTPPAWATLLLAAGILERDGCFVVAGYVVLLLTILLFAGLAIAALFFGAEIQSWLWPRRG